MIYKPAVKIKEIERQIDLIQKEAFKRMKDTQYFMYVKEQLLADIEEICNQNTQFDFVINPLISHYQCNLFKVVIIEPLHEQENTYFKWLRGGRPLGDTTVMLLQEAISKLNMKTKERKQ
jgi:hypothetical protein